MLTFSSDRHVSGAAEADWGLEEGFMEVVMVIGKGKDEKND
jgi:hypothetical protein